MSREGASARPRLSSRWQLRAHQTRTRATAAFRPPPKASAGRRCCLPSRCYGSGSWATPCSAAGGATSGDEGVRLRGRFAHARARPARSPTRHRHPSAARLRSVCAHRPRAARLRLAGFPQTHTRRFSVAYDVAIDLENHYVYAEVGAAARRTPALGRRRAARCLAAARRAASPKRRPSHRCCRAPDAALCVPAESDHRHIAGGRRVAGGRADARTTRRHVTGA